MSLYSKVFDQLENGSWVIEEILARFEKKLQTNLGVPKANFTVSELCLSHYSKINLNDGLRLRSNSFGLNDLNFDVKAKAYLATILKKDFPNAEFDDFSEEDKSKINAAMLLVNNFQNFESSIPLSAFQIYLKIRNVKFRSASHPHLFGVMLVGEGIKDFTAEQISVSIIHELAHQELFLINLLDRLVNQEFDYHKIHAPFQGVKRPPLGRIHSLWALYRMVRFQKSMGKPNLKHEDLLRQNIEAFDKGELTEFGKHIVDIAKTEVA